MIFSINFLMSITVFFFFEFFDLFAEVNASDCYVVYKNKPKYGPCHLPKATLEISFL